MKLNNPRDKPRGPVYPFLNRQGHHMSHLKRRERVEQDLPELSRFSRPGWVRARLAFVRGLTFLTRYRHLGEISRVACQDNAIFGRKTAIYA